MNKLIMLVAALATCTPVYAAPAASAAPSRAMKQLYDKGFHDCAGPLDQTVKGAHEDDTTYSYLDVWSQRAPNTSVGSALTIQQFTDGRVVNAISVVKNTAGTCDMVVTTVIPLIEQTCASLRADSFKHWKRREEFAPLEIYEDPEMASSTVSMSPLGLNGCLLVKHTVAYEAAP